jgi:hypothetical protein
VAKEPIIGLDGWWYDNNPNVHEVTYDGKRWPWRKLRRTTLKDFYYAFYHETWMQDDRGGMKHIADDMPLEREGKWSERNPCQMFLMDGWTIRHQDLKQLRGKWASLYANDRRNAAVLVQAPRFLTENTKWLIGIVLSVGLGIAQYIT